MKHHLIQGVFPMPTIWQTYRGTAARKRQNAITVSISRKCSINLSRAAAWLIGNPGWVLMMYDERNSVIGMTASTEDTPGAFLLRQRERDGGRTVCVTPFCRHFRIQVDGTEQFDDPTVDEDGVLRLDLKRTHRVEQRNPYKRTAAPTVPSPQTAGSHMSEPSA
jgi:hypothetical protein